MDDVRQRGIVMGVKGDMAMVRFTRSDACGHCNACFHFGSNETDIELKNTLSAKAGDIVSLELHGKSVVKASALAYGIPLVALLIGVGVGSAFGDLYAALGGVLFAAGSFFIMRGLEPRFERMNEFKPRMIAILPPSARD